MYILYKLLRDFNYSTSIILKLVNTLPTISPLSPYIVLTVIHGSWVTREIYGLVIWLLPFITSINHGLKAKFNPMPFVLSDAITFPSLSVTYTKSSVDCYS